MKLATAHSEKFHRLFNSLILKVFFLANLFVTLLFFQSTCQSVYSLPANDDVCPGEMATYTVTWTTGTPVPASVVFNVTGSIQTLPNGISITVTWNNPGAGTIVADCYDANGQFVSTNTCNVTIHDKPTPVITASSIVNCTEYGDELHDPVLDPTECWLVCERSTVIYETALNSGSTYSWSVTGALNFIVNQNEVMVNWGTYGTGTISVTETNSFGCVTTVEKCIIKIKSPSAYFNTLPYSDINSGNPLVICKGQTVHFFGQASDQGGSQIVSWFWDFGDGGTSVDQNPSYTYIIPDPSYSIKLTVTNACGCSYTIELKLVVTPDQIVDIECASPVCEGAIETYSTSAVCQEYYWTVTNGQIIPATGPYGPTIQVQWGSGNSGPGVVSLEGLNCNTNCTSTASILIPIFSLSFPITGPNPACTNTQQTYSVPLVPGTVYTWIINSGSATVVHGQGTNEVVVDFSNGSGQVVLQVDYENKFLNCGPGQSIITIDIHENFSIDEAEDICIGESVTFNCSINISGAIIRWKITNSSNTTVYSHNGYDNFITISSWAYGPGTFTISVENLQGYYCTSKQTIQFTVLDAPPAPQFTSGDLNVCNNSSHVYTALALPGHYLEWEITNNGSTSTYTGNSINITWGSSPYGIQIFQVSNNSGCRSVTSTPVSINEIVPVTPIFSGEQSPCTNSTVTYNITNFSLMHPDLMEWSIDPPAAGSIVLGQNTSSVEVLWNNLQIPATIKVKIITCGIEDTPPLPGDYEYPINIGGLSGYEILTSGSLCSGTPNETSFSVSPSPPGSATYSWDFGDGGTATSANPDHTYTLLSSSSSTNFPVTLTLEDNDCKTSISTSVQIYPSPVFSILSDNHVICPPNTTNATLSISTQQSTNLAYNWSTGATTSSINVTSAGYYTISVTNTVSQCISIATLQIQGCGGSGGCTSGGYNPTFNLPITYHTECGSVTFQNLDVGTATYWFLDFGDNTTDNSIPDVNHTYTSAGIYYACLNAQDAQSPTYCDQFCTLVEIPLYADFNFTIECGTSTQYNVHLFDLSTFIPSSVWPGHAITGWNYIIQGPLPSPSTVTISGQNPVTSLAPGDYNITLVITDNLSNTCSKTINGIHIPVPPDPTFTVSDPVGSFTGFCEEQSVVHFTATNQSGYFSLLWKFDDLDVNTNEAEYFQMYNSGDPNTWQADRTFDNNGNHSVRLTVKDVYGCSISFNTDVFIETNNLSGALQPFNQTVCPGQFASITYNNAGGAFTNLLWSNNATTNPSISVSTIGQYNATVTNTSTGCTFHPVKFADVGNYNTPVPSIFGELQYCLNEPIVLSGDIGNYNYQWNIGSLTYQSGTMNDANITILPPTAAGIYPISLTISDINCSLTTNVNIEVINPPPSPVIVATPTPPLCEGILYSLDVDASNPGNIYHVNWSTGASTNSISVANANVYQVTFTNDAGCTASSSVVIHELPNLDWVVFGCFDYCTSDDIKIPGSSNQYSNWQWLVEDINGTYYTLLGSGSVSDLILGMLPPGVYTITLKVEDPISGCNNASEPITLTVRTCPCQIIKEVKENITCVGVDANNISHYVFTFDVNFNTPVPLPGYITITSATIGMGISVLQNSAILTDPHSISGVLTFDPSYHVVSFCVVLTYTDPLEPKNNCTFPYCFKLPDCKEIGPCEYKLRIVSITCGDQDLAGNQIYNLTYNINPPPPLLNVFFSSPNGSLSGFPATVNGAGPYTGTFIDTPPADQKLCIQVNYYDNEAVCFSFDCYALPDCQGDPDRNQGTLNDSSPQISMLSLSPNPTSDHVKIDFNLKNSKNGTISFVDTKGKKLFGFNVGSQGEINQNTTSLESGIYFVILESINNERIVKKLVIIKN